MIERKYFLFPVFFPLLAGCVNDSASYPFGTEQSLTLVREQPYFWDEEIRRAMVVMNLPQCAVRYKLPMDNGKAGNMQVFRSEGGDFTMQDGLGRYRAAVANCNMALEGRSSEAPGELIGSFEPSRDGRMHFIPAKK